MSQVIDELEGTDHSPSASIAQRTPEFSTSVPTATHEVLDAHDTEENGEFDPNDTVGVFVIADHDAPPLEVETMPDRPTATQNEVVGQEIAAKFSVKPLND